MRFPARGDAFLTKDQVADYLVDYAGVSIYQYGMESAWTGYGRKTDGSL